jgi:NAD(P)-dependent dehydrogenase (short-subunit alcohol dehydrogenase family)
MNLTASRIVIVGGSSGIGLATARAAAEGGADVVIVSSRKSSIDTALSRLGGNVTGQVLDVLDQDAVAGFFAELGPYDHLAYTAGEPLTLMPLNGMDIDRARDFFQIRFFGALTVVRHAAPNIRPGGSITLTSGSARTRPGAGWSLGASISGAVTSLTKALAVELAPIRVNCVEPGIVRSPLWSGMTPDEQQQMFDQQADVVPVGRVGEVDDVARAFLYAMTQTFSSGASIPVDGGAVLA